MHVKTFEVVHAFDFRILSPLVWVNVSFFDPYHALNWLLAQVSSLTLVVIASPRLGSQIEYLNNNLNFERKNQSKDFQIKNLPM
jgi:hypothetical protein